MFSRIDPERANARISVALGVTTLAVVTVMLSRCAAGDSAAQPKARVTSKAAVSSLPAVAPALAPDGPTVDPNVPPTVPAGGASPEVAGATPTTTESSAMGLETPVAASRNLFDSWRENDRVRALEYASLPAVETLFAEKWGAEVNDTGCNATPDPTVFRCTYVKDRKGWVATIAGNAARGFRVRVVIVVARTAGSAGPITSAPQTSIPQPLDTAVPSYVPEDAPIDPELIPPDPLDPGVVGDPTVDGIGPPTPLDTAPTGAAPSTDGLPVGPAAPGSPGAVVSPNPGATPLAKPKAKPKPKPKPVKKQAPKAKSAVGTPDPITAPEPPPPPPPAATPGPVPAGADPVQVVDG